MDEHRPLLLSAPRDIAITIHGESSDEYDEYVGSAGRSSASVFRYTSFRASNGSLAAVSPRYFQQLDQREHVQAQAQATLLSRKYVTYPVEDVVGQKRSRSKVAVAGYGTMAVKPEDEDGSGQSTKKKTAAPSSLRSLLCKMDDPRKTKSCSSFNPEHLPSNQSETESDSDGSCGSNTSSSNSSSSSSLQSILRIRDGIYACRKVRKQVSVEFSLDVDYKDIDDEADERRKGSKASGLLCASNCMPRRLTIEEKAALYRIRPDLQLTPMPLILRELEEIRRRRQRKLMFSILGGTLIMLMIIVFYYLLTETP